MIYYQIIFRGIYKMTTIVLSGDTTIIAKQFTMPLVLEENKEYEAALIHLSTYNSIPNITQNNNVFKYSTDGGASWKIIELEKGAYEFKDIINEIKEIMYVNGDYIINDNGKIAYFIDFDIKQLSCLIEIANENYKIDFNCENSIGSVFGFGTEMLERGYHKSPQNIKITNINSILVNVDLISHSYLNENLFPILYEFYPKVPLGYKIIEKPHSLIYLPVNRKFSIGEIRLWLTDQDLNPIDLQGETLTVNIHIREKKF